MTNTRTVIRAVTVAGAAAVVALAGSVTAAHAEEVVDSSRNGSATANQEVVDVDRESGVVAALNAVAVPAGAKQYDNLRTVSGVYNYTCKNGAWGGNPEAQLEGARIGKVRHYGGPAWTHVGDSSTLVQYKKLAQADRPGTLSFVLWQVRQKVNSGGYPVDASGKVIKYNGKLVGVRYIQRINTGGGAAPKGSCKDGAKASSKFTALYVLWK